LFFTQKVDEGDDVLGFVCDWIEALAHRLDRLHCVCLEAGRIPAFARRVQIHSLGKERGYNRARLVWESQRVLRALVSGGAVDAVLVHMVPLFTLLTYPWAARRSLPLLTWYTHRQVTPLLRLAVAMSDRVLTAARDSIGIRSDKVVVTGHGIATPREEDLSFDETLPREVLAVGRLTPIKRWETFIEAASLLKGEGYRFRMVGDAVLDSDLVYRERLQRLALSRGLSTVLSFDGAVPYREMPTCYQRAFCTVNTCVDSSFDKAVLESMAFGRPALTSNRAFAPLLGSETPPLLFPEGDAAALASRIRGIAATSLVARKALGLRLRNSVEREHGLERLMDRIVELLEGVISQRCGAQEPEGPSVSIGAV
jgi:glycosyltransferase involved in cell wall biosynthesis